MKGITKKLIQAMALVAVFGLASCTTTPVNDDTTGGSTGGGTSGGGSTGGGTSGGSTAEGYVVQLIASKSASKAESIKNEFAGEGYNKAHVSALGDVFRVQIGPYGSEADAQRVLDQMRRRYKQNVNVNNAVVKTVNGS